MTPLTSDPTKFFGCELGAQTSFADDRYIVNGAHQADRLRELLDTFIEKFVLCPSCKNPETDLVILGKAKHEDIERDCKACGRHNGVDMRHKLITYIIKNPPKKDKGSKLRKAATAEANIGGPLVFDAAAEDGDEDDMGGLGQIPAVPTSGTDIDAALGKTEAMMPESPVAPSSETFAADHVNGSMARKLNGVSLDDEDEDDAADSPYAILGTWLEEHRTASDAEIVAQIKELGVMGKHKVLVNVGEKLFTDKVDEEVKKRSIFLQAVSTR